MIRYSVLVLDQNVPADVLQRQVLTIRDVLSRLRETFEIICLHAGSGAGRHASTGQRTAEPSDCQGLHLPPGSRLGEAVTTGIARARGEVLLVLEAGLHYAPEEIPRLLERLTRADLVYGKRPRHGLAKLWQRVVRVPRWLLLGLEVRDPNCLYWAARREAVARLDLSGELHRHIATLVAARGFRVDEAPVHDARRWWWEFSRPSALFTAWRLSRCYRAHLRGRMHTGGEVLLSSATGTDSGGVPARPSAQQRRAA